MNKFARSNSTNKQHTVSYIDIDTSQTWTSTRNDFWVIHGHNSALFDTPTNTKAIANDMDHMHWHCCHGLDINQQCWSSNPPQLTHCILIPCMRHTVCLHSNFEILCISLFFHRTNSKDFAQPLKPEIPLATANLKPHQLHLYNPDPRVGPIVRLYVFGYALSHNDLLKWADDNQIVPEKMDINRTYLTWKAIFLRIVVVGLVLGVKMVQWGMALSLLPMRRWRIWRGRRI